MTTVTQTKERPILFSGPMVKAILEGRKTQTRRIVKREFMHDPNGTRNARWYIRRADAIWNSFETLQELVMKHCPYGQPGDRLWVRETHRINPWIYNDPRMGPGTPGCVVYRADPHDPEYDEMKVWKPSIFMPRWASRITLEITDVRVERLQEISDSDAINEGITGVLDDGIWSYNGHVLPRDGFTDLWNKINGADSWNANPWVWVVSFEVVR